VLDLDRNCPPILSHPDYLNQIFGILFNLGKNYGGGACIQTKYADESVYLRFLFTGTLESRSKHAYENDIRFLNNLVSRHEGTIKISRQFEKEKPVGTIIIISFPFKRRIRE
jgi:hypothetical protein